ncbi:MAG: hypothetical protein AAF655_18645 [Bacteroidota bacterium]
MSDIQTHIKEIRHLITEASLGEALEKADALLKGSEQYRTLLIRTAQHNQLVQDMIKGTIDYSTRQLQQAQIQDALLLMLSELENGSHYNPSLKAEIEALLASPEPSSGNTTITGNHNIIIKGVSDSEIKINQGGKEKE